MSSIHIDTAATNVVIASAVGTIFLSECIYKLLVFDTDKYKQDTSKFTSLTKRQLSLKRLERTEKQTKKERNEFQSNMTMLRALKRTIQKQRHIAQLITALLTAIVFKILSSTYENVAVARLPFYTFSLLRNLSTYKLDVDQDGESQLLSAPSLFILTFISLKLIVRKLFFINPIRMLPRQPLGVSLPRTMFMRQNSGTLSMSKEDIVQNFLGFILSTWYSIYSIYKALKKYNNVKYIVSITRVVSRITGFFCSLWLPVPLRYVFYGGFAKFYGINMEEVEEPDFGFYETFTKFFTRKLKKGVRTIEEENKTKSMCSPCDGRVLTCGLINSEFSTIDCVKGRSYRLDEFMLGVQGNQVDKTEHTSVLPNNESVAAMLDKVKQRGNQLMYMVIYLSPADYHRFHSPAIHTADFRRHIVGYLSPVKPSHVNKHKDVFKNNERVNIFGRWAQGFYFESAVGATNVGSIKLDFDTDVLTNKAVPRYPYYEDQSYIKSMTSDKSGPFREYLTQDTFDNIKCNKISKNFQKGEMTGRFEMGSTIVLIFEADKNTELKVEEGMKLWLGQKIVDHKE